MIVADFHVHSTFSVDGMSTMEQHCIAAIQKGIKKICFTEHVDYNIAEYNVGKVKDNRKQNFDIKEYFNEIERHNALYYPSIEILSGIIFYSSIFKIKSYKRILFNSIDKSASRSVIYL